MNNETSWNSGFSNIIAIKSYSLHSISQQSSTLKSVLAQTDNFLIQTVDIVIGQFFFIFHEARSAETNEMGDREPKYYPILLMGYTG